MCNLLIDIEVKIAIYKFNCKSFILNSNIIFEVLILLKYLIAQLFDN